MISSGVLFLGQVSPTMLLGCASRPYKLWKNAGRLGLLVLRVVIGLQRCSDVVAMFFWDEKGKKKKKK
jgi:hypothetical protein